MNRKSLALVALVALAVAGVLVGVAAHSAAEKADGPRKARYVHTVIFTLKADAPKDAASELIADCHAMLAKIPTVRELRAGRRADKGSPKLARKDFSVALTIFFDDFDGLTAYDKDELHQTFVKKHLRHVDTSKLLVYDYEDQAK